MDVLKSIPAVAVKVRLGFRRLGDEPRGGIPVNRQLVPAGQGASQVDGTATS